MELYKLKKQAVILIQLLVFSEIFRAFLILSQNNVRLRQAQSDKSKVRYLG